MKSIFLESIITKMDLIGNLIFMFYLYTLAMLNININYIVKIRDYSILTGLFYFIEIFVFDLGNFYTFIICFCICLVNLLLSTTFFLSKGNKIIILLLFISSF